MPSELALVTSVALAAQSRVAGVYNSVNLTDAYAIELPAGRICRP